MAHIYEAVPLRDDESHETENTRQYLPPNRRCGRIITSQIFIFILVTCTILMFGLFMQMQNTPYGNFIYFHFILCSRNEIFTS